LRQKDDPTKGAHVIGRYYVKDFQIKAKYVIKPSDIDKAYVNEGVRTFIFVDDISGTGSTFLDVYSECDINQMNNSYLIFSPLAIHEKAIKKINLVCKNIKYCFSEKLDKTHSFFSFGEEIFIDGAPVTDQIKAM